MKRASRFVECAICVADNVSDVVLWSDDGCGECGVCVHAQGKVIPYNVDTSESFLPSARGITTQGHLSPIHSNPNPQDSTPVKPG